MSEKRKPQGNPTTELINLRFYENQKRQALTTTDLQRVEGEGDEEDDVNLSSSVTTSCPSGELEQLNPTPPVSTGPGSFSQTSSPSSLAPAAAPPPSSDKSRKGSVDQRIWNLVNLINGEKDKFFTTSSCSGRIILYTWEKGEGDSSVDGAKLKKGCKWLLVSHDEVQPDELVSAYRSCGTEGSRQDDDVYFKMEPCILHVQCRVLSDARKLIHLATESGFRNSGMVIGKENRITVAIRSAMGLEVPLPCPVGQSGNPSSPIITEEYLKYLVTIANAKMRENWTRSDKLTGLFSSTSWKT